ncbi:MAG TPA: hypothetical protein VGQ93_05575 [Lysobacter sp.]|nr:hypothetical protein [Lysobacter sp.]
MRQVFSSPRLENVEAVAQMLRDAGIEVRISDGRSYKGAMRSRPSYSDQSAPKPAVWVVQSDDQVRAREILREHGLIETTRPGDSFVPPSFRDEETRYAKTSAQQRTFRFKVFLLAVMAVIIVLAMLRGCYAPKQDEAVGLPRVSDQARRAGGTPESLALAVFAKEVPNEKMVLCLSIDDADASAAVIAAMKQPSNNVVPASECVREFDPDKGSYHAASGKPALLATVRSFKATGPDAGTVEFESFHHGQFAHYKTLEMKRVGGAWQVVKVLRHVASYGMSG